MPEFVLDGQKRPIANIYCIGRNYAEHAKELNNPIPTTPMVFLKSTSSVRGMRADAVAFPADEFHHEVEVVLSIGQPASLGSKASESLISGVALGLDMTRRGVQSQLKKDGHPWTTAKSFSGAAVLAPFVGIKSIPDLLNLRFGLDINGERKQYGTTADLLNKPLVLLDYLLSFNDLMPGDLIFTGTPAGVGPMKRGDRFKLYMDGLNYSYEGIL